VNKIFVAIPTGGGFSVVRVLALYCVPIVVMRGELVLDIGSLFFVDTKCGIYVVHYSCVCPSFPEGICQHEVMAMA